MKPALVSEVVYMVWDVYFHICDEWDALENFYVGIPGYLERRYREWSTSRGHFNRWVVDLRFLALANVLVSAAVAIPMSTSMTHPG